MNISFVDHWDDFQSSSTMNRSCLHLSTRGCLLLLKNLKLVVPYQRHLMPSECRTLPVVCIPAALPQPAAPPVTREPAPSTTAPVLASTSPTTTLRTYATVASAPTSRPCTSVPQSPLQPAGFPTLRIVRSHGPSVCGKPPRVPVSPLHPLQRRDQTPKVPTLHHLQRRDQTPKVPTLHSLTHGPCLPTSPSQ